MHHSKEIEYLFSLSNLGWKLGLNKIRALLTEIGNPQDKYPTIHVAGTNGKGSTAALITSILKTAGYDTGLYTSPHLISVCERIKYNDQSIDLDDLIYYIRLLKPLIEKYRCTFFESMTAIAFVYFADRKVDAAVIEVGLGGRLDATNVINPILTIITEIEHDHTKQLGRSRQKIAMEKGGIIKREAPCLTNTQHKIVQDILSAICKERRTELIQVPKLSTVDNVLLNEKFTSFDLRVNGAVFPQLKLALIGEHQLQNAKLAVTAAHILGQKHFQIKIEDIYHGLMDVNWDGRLQLISTAPKFLIDVAHNPDGTDKLVRSIRSIFSYRDLFVIFGVCKDKNYPLMIKKMSFITDHFIFVKADTSRASEPLELAREASHYPIPVQTFNHVSDGVEYALNNSGQSDLILGTGSHYTVGEIIIKIKKLDNLKKNS